MTNRANKMTQITPIGYLTDGHKHSFNCLHLFNVQNVDITKTAQTLHHTLISPLGQHIDHYQLLHFILNV